MAVFSYSPSPHVRRHGPLGYEDYQAYKPWLRDEFEFRCIFCLRRERWEPDPRANFSVDHLVPQVRAPERACDYDNLVYACTACNYYKRDQLLDLAPCSDAFDLHLRVGNDGVVEALSPQGAALIDRLLLNEPERVRFRSWTLRFIQTLAESSVPEAAALLAEFLSYPDTLPDLHRLRPPGGNMRPEGLAGSHFARRERGELPPTY
jgi:HNH endonuclease